MHLPAQRYNQATVTVFNVDFEFIFSNNEMLLNPLTSSYIRQRVGSGRECLLPRRQEQPLQQTTCAELDH